MISINTTFIEKQSKSIEIDEKHKNKRAAQIAATDTGPCTWKAECCSAGRAQEWVHAQKRELFP